MNFSLTVKFNKQMNIYYRLETGIQLTLKTSISSVVTCDLAVKLYRKTKTVNSLLWGLQIIQSSMETV